MCKPDIVLTYVLPIFMIFGACMAPFVLWETPLDQEVMDTFTPSSCYIMNVTQEDHPEDWETGLRVHVTYPDAEGNMLESDVYVCYWQTAAMKNKCATFYRQGMTFTCVFDPSNPYNVYSYGDVARGVLDNLSLSGVLLLVWSLFAVVGLSDTLAGLSAVMSVLFVLVLSPILLTFRLYRSLKEKNFPGERRFGDSTPTSSSSSGSTNCMGSYFLIESMLGRTPVLTSGEDLPTSYLISSNDAHSEDSQSSSSASLLSDPDELPAQPSPDMESDVATSLSKLGHMLPSQFSKHFVDRSDGMMELVLGETMIWVEQPQQFTLTTYLHSATSFIAWAQLLVLTVGCAYLSWVFGTETQADVDAFWLTFPAIWSLLVINLLTVILRPWLVNRCFVLTSKRLLVLSQLRLLCWSVPLSFTGVWTSEVVHRDQILIRERAIDADVTVSVSDKPAIRIERISKKEAHLLIAHLIPKID